MSKIKFGLLRKAASIIEGIPDAQFDLDYIAKNGCNAHTCGTVGCVMGWLSMHPDFQKQGLGLKNGFSFGSDAYYDTTYKGEAVDFDFAASKLFGITKEDACDLFGPYGGSGGSIHKQVFRQRIIRFFEQHGKNVSPKYRALQENFYTSESF